MNMTYDQLLNFTQELLEKKASMPKDEFRKEAMKAIHVAQKFGVANEIKHVLHSSNKISHAMHVRKEKGLYDEEDSVNYLPLRNVEEVKVAADWLVRYRDRFPYEKRKEMAIRILAKSAGANLDNETKRTLLRISGLGLGNRDDVVKQIKKRAEYFKYRGHEGKAKFLEAFADKIEKTEDWESFYKTGAAHALARELDEIDRVTSIHALYNVHYKPPEDFLFDTTAQDVDMLKQELLFNEKTGKCYRMQDLTDLDTKTLEDFFGESFVKQATIGPYIDKEFIKYWLETEATDNQKELFDQVLAYSGIKPYLEKVPQ